MRQLRQRDTRSRELVEIMADVVASASRECVLTVMDASGESHDIDCPELNYVFGSAQYIKEVLADMSLTGKGNEMKFPLVALFCPFTEQRGSLEWKGKASVSLLIAYSTMKKWSNEQRRVYSFVNILRPIYESLLEAIEADGRFIIDYEGGIPHRYSENYSYGRYGAHTPNGEEVSEPIDAILLTNVELKIKNTNCL